MANPNIAEIVTTTIENRSKKLADNVSKNHALLDRLEKKGKRKPVSGGRQIWQELEYSENNTFGWYSGYDPVNISPQDVFTSTQWDWKQCAAAVSISGLEELQNSGAQQMIDLLQSRIENAEKTMKNRMGAAVYGDGTAAGGKAIGGLQLLIPDAPTAGVVGGIDRSVWTFWRSQVFSGLNTGGAAVSTANIVAYMTRLWFSLIRGTDAPDMIIADNNYFLTYMGALQPAQRFTSPEMAQAGFQSLKFMSADVVFDGGIGGACPANHMYYLNTDYIYLRPHADREYTPIGGSRMPANQDAMVKMMGWAGNMTLSGSMFQGVLIA